MLRVAGWAIPEGFNGGSSALLPAEHARAQNLGAVREKQTKRNDCIIAKCSFPSTASSLPNVKFRHGVTIASQHPEVIAPRLRYRDRASELTHTP